MWFIQIWLMVVGILTTTQRIYLSSNYQAICTQILFMEQPWPVNSSLVQTSSLRTSHKCEFCQTLLSSTVLPPPQPSASSLSNDSITVSWAPVAHAAQYTLSVYKFNSSDNMKYMNTSSTNLTISGLDAGSLYVTSVHAWDTEGRKGDSSLYINQTTRKEALW